VKPYAKDAAWVLLGVFCRAVMRTRSYLYQTSARVRRIFTARNGGFLSWGPVSETYRQRAFAVPPDATELIVIRHGASAALEPGETFELVEGHGDPPLAPEGREQALRVAERLHGEPLRALFVTPLQRTHQTMEPLAAATGLQPRVISDLREVHLGEWEGGEYRRRMHERDPVAMKALMEERWDLIPGGEPMEALGARVSSGLDTMLAKIGPGGTGAAVLHGGVIGELCHQVTRSRRFAFIHADNCSITRVVQFAIGHRLLRSFNDTAHLA
jgi:2,3-bisphosphoglycerate-dependent phosphoglycerate mutase